MDSLKLFLDHLKIDQGASVHTQSAYLQDLKQFQATLKKNTLPHATESDVQFFLKQLKKTEHQSTSIARKVSALKQFYKFLLSENIIEEDPTLFIEAPVRKQRLPKALDTENILKLLQAADLGLPYTNASRGERSNSKKAEPDPLQHALNLRDAAMIYLLYAAGLRVTELTTLKTSQADIESGFVRVMGKRSKERMVPIAPIAGEKLYEYLTHARPLFQPKSEVLFLGRRGEPLTRQAFWKTLKKLATLAGLPVNLHPHMLRHTFATDLLKSGMNLRSLQMLLGHADLQTTQIYTHLTPDSLAEVIDRYHPRGAGASRGKSK